MSTENTKQASDNMLPEVRALATKIARGKGMNADDRELMMSVYAGDAGQCSAFKNLIIALGKKVEKLTVEMLDGQGRFGRYMKINVPGSYKSLNMGKRKFEQFIAAVETIGYENIVNAFDAKELHAPWEFDVVEK